MNGTGRNATATCPPSGRPPPGGPDPREPIAVLADILDRDGTQLSATETRQRNLANADHLAVLGAIWAAETRQAHDTRYRDLVMAALPPGYRQELSHQASWLYRTLRSAELAGLDPAEVARTAIESRDLAGARDIAASSTPGSASASTRCSPSRKAPGPGVSPSCPTRSGRRYLAEIATDDGRPQAAPRPARRRARPRVGGQGPRPGPRTILPPGKNGSARRPRSAPTGRCTATSTPTTRSAPSPPTTPPTSAPPGTKPSSPSAPPTARTCAPCPTAGCG